MKSIILFFNGSDMPTFEFVTLAESPVACMSTKNPPVLCMYCVRDGEDVP